MWRKLYSLLEEAKENKDPVDRSCIQSCDFSVRHATIKKFTYLLTKNTREPKVNGFYLLRIELGLEGSYDLDIERI